MAGRFSKKLGILFALMGVTYWWCHSDGYAPIVLALSLIILFTIQEVIDSPTRLYDNDERLFGQLLKALPSNDSIHYIKSHDMAGLIDPTCISDLKEIRVSWNDAEHRFCNKALDKRFGRLYGLIDKYLDFYASCTFVDDNDRRAVRVYPGMAETDPVRFFSTVEKLHKMADEIVSAHQKFIEFGTRAIARANKERAKPWWRPTPTRVIGLVSGLAGYGVAVWTIASNVNSSRIEMAEAASRSWQARFETLSQKTEGLLEPLLFYEDTLVGSTAMLLSHGGKVEIRLYPIYRQRAVAGSGFGDLLNKISFTYWNAVDSVSDEIELSADEPWEYTVDGKQFFLTFEILDATLPELVGRIYEVKPLYNPAR
jgi:hypothetical protein